MALNIKNPEVERLARELSSASGTSITDVVMAALRARSDHMARERSAESVLAEVKEVQEFLKSQPDRDSRSADEILGYDEYGLFR